MNKIVALVSSLLAVVLFVVPAFAKVERVPGDWTFSDPLLVTYNIGAGTYPHSYNIASYDPATGDFSGTGTYLNAPGYSETITGDINGDIITFTILYTGANPGYTLSMTGTIADNGSLSGTIDGSSNTWSAPEQSLTRFIGNHGQYVKAQEDKQEAAHSLVGMPVQSNKDHVE